MSMADGTQASGRERGTPGGRGRSLEWHLRAQHLPVLTALAPGPAPTGGLPQGHRAAEDSDTGLETTHHGDVLHGTHVRPAERTEGTKPARTQVSRSTAMPSRLETVTISCDLRAPGTPEPKGVSCLRRGRGHGQVEGIQ